MNLSKDDNIIAAIKLGDKNVLSALYLKYYNHLSHFGIKIINKNDLVEECIQELFLYIFESHKRLGDINCIKSYLFKSLRRRILEKIKKERQKLEADYLIAQRTNIQFSEGEILFKEYELRHKKNALTEALNNLPWRQREAIYLRYYNGLSTHEIAQIMGAANQTILNTIYQALKKIRKNIVVLDVAKKNSL